MRTTRATTRRRTSLMVRCERAARTRPDVDGTVASLHSYSHVAHSAAYIPFNVSICSRADVTCVFAAVKSDIVVPVFCVLESGPLVK